LPLQRTGPMPSPDNGPVYETRASCLTVREIPEGLRPREEMERVGPENVSDAVLLAIILRSGTRGANVIDLASDILRRYGSLTGLASSSVADIARARGVGKVKAQTIMAAFELGRRLSRESLPQGLRVRTPGDVASVLRERARTQQREVFWVLHLDAKNRLRKEAEEVSHGLLDASLVHPREVFREAIRASTAAVILAHNHPSGDPTPSAEDIRITKQLVSAGRIVDIKVLDHVIMGKRGMGDETDFLSIREEGLVEFGG
jgi:DNA repair protein RadC